MFNAKPIDIVYLHGSDNVCVAAHDLAAGSRISAGGLTVELPGPVKLGHKIALKSIDSGQPVVKYGQTIGFTTEDVAAGTWIHTHNLTAGQFARDYASASEIPPDPRPLAGRTFQGFRRPSGQAGTRNYVAVISTVNCSASVSKYVAARFNADALKQFPNVDGVVAFTHGGGCGMQFGGEGHATLNRVMGGMARHPNIGGYVLIGLGCETASLGYLLDDQKLVQIGGGRAGSAKRPPVLSMQDVGGTAKTIEAACRLVEDMLPRANDVRREAIPLSELILGTNCGGSDGNSGITANPALGVASDMIVAAGGTVILGETTEIYGAEQLLTRRARSPEIAQKLIDRIKWWEWYTGLFGCTPDNNPSPGNKDGGLTTIYEKSLGAVAKAGSTAMTEVYQYAEQVTAKGFVVMDTPGLDPVSVTGIVAGGAQVMVFTTGRGSCFGCKPTPSIKVATNTPMYERMIDDMDLDAGTILKGRGVDDVGREIFEEIIAVAGGKRTKSENHGIGQEEFVPWQIGPTL
ncbi:MAG TPA: altronate dehydratase family protein [Pirellulales bacterium]|jgi:altronate hydrolase|nr:altronate dehydratase family protein [Pirellulales bacterium]